jgi:hypothetical protein
MSDKKKSFIEEMIDLKTAFQEMPHLSKTFGHIKLPPLQMHGTEPEAILGERPLDLLVRMLQKKGNSPAETYAAHARLVEAYAHYAPYYPITDRPALVIRQGKGNA